jgi:hypothetical protein
MPIARWWRKREDALGQLERCSSCGAGVDVYARSCSTCGQDLSAQKVGAFRKLRDAGGMTDAAFAEAVRLLDEVARPTPPSTSSPRIRKQVGDLALSDLVECPVWEFAIDEEGEEGQDEETVKPRPDVKLADPSDGLFLVRAEFSAADGTRFDGFVSPHEERHLGYTQPTIVTHAGHVRFWFGIVPPTRSALDASYRALEKTAGDLFPLRYRALVAHAGAKLQGEIDGFMHYEAGDTARIAVLT